MQKDLIIGGCYGYDFKKIEPWVNSINMTGFKGDKVLVILSDETTKNNDKLLINELKNHQFEVEMFPRNPAIAPHVDRFFYIYNVLKHNNSKWNNVLTTDVRDVIFQDNPFEWLQNTFKPYYLNISTKMLYVSSECLFYKDEPWGNQNLYDTFGPYIYELYKNNVIYNVGVLFGNVDYIQQLCLDIAIGSINKPITICDQAVFNYLMANEFYKPHVEYMIMNYGWAAHLGTVMDPQKIEYFRPKLLENEPHFSEDGTLFTYNNKKICIVHQYDRTPWRDKIVRKYT